MKQSYSIERFYYSKSHALMAARKVPLPKDNGVQSLGPAALNHARSGAA